MFSNLCTKRGGSLQKERFSFLFQSSMAGGGGVDLRTPPCVRHCMAAISLFNRRARQRCFWLLAFISRPQVRNIHLPGRMILPGSLIPSDKCRHDFPSGRPGRTLLFSCLSLFNLKLIFLLYSIDRCSNCMILNFPASSEENVKNCFT